MNKTTMIGRRVRGNSWKHGNRSATNRFAPYRDYTLDDMRTRPAKRRAYKALCILSDLGCSFDELPFTKQVLIMTAANIATRLEDMQAQMIHSEHVGKKISKSLIHDHDSLAALFLKVGDKLGWSRQAKEISLQKYVEQTYGTEVSK